MNKIECLYIYTSCIPASIQPLRLGLVPYQKGRTQTYLASELDSALFVICRTFFRLISNVRTKSLAEYIEFRPAILSEIKKECRRMCRLTLPDPILNWGLKKTELHSLNPRVNVVNMRKAAWKWGIAMWWYKGIPSESEQIYPSYRK